MDTRVSGTAVVQKDMRECINDIEKAGFGPRAVARDRMFKAKSKKIGQLLNDSRDSLIRSLHETVEADRKKKDADIEMKTALLNSAGSARQVMSRFQMINSMLNVLFFMFSRFLCLALY
ncbi:PREDICTED: uncharacterized protein LOC106317373 isoform X2 [Brassica oleracea var. oleracea]|uniref:uncharacterized protein LOC106317373 isoform X2 n=1 Tax=Brassica oleracea var. oleracea TaxID=109376 RepID=UPI0006A72CD7|nr:PREDICTED: uncharacterized protein LOC106317373 isoform X2 [Brassica oleracea var. oleracea]